MMATDSVTVTAKVRVKAKGWGTVMAKAMATERDWEKATGWEKEKVMERAMVTAMDSDSP